MERRRGERENGKTVKYENSRSRVEKRKRLSVEIDGDESDENTQPKFEKGEENMILRKILQNRTSEQDLE